MGSLKNILMALAIVTFTLLILSLGFKSAKADEHSYIDNPNLAGGTVPVICGEPTYVYEFIASKGFIPETASLGRAGAEATGDPVMMVTEFKMEDQKIYTIDIPSGEQTCILVHTFNRTSLTKENND
tara:strand:- start:961 stop:1341 length:381 start_codon:yes stop_codon:yes gene_type:complete